MPRLVVARPAVLVRSSSLMKYPTAVLKDVQVFLCLVAKQQNQLILMIKNVGEIWQTNNSRTLTCKVSWIEYLVPIQPVRIEADVFCVVQSLGVSSISMKGSPVRSRKQQKTIFCRGTMITMCWGEANLRTGLL